MGKIWLTSKTGPMRGLLRSLSTCLLIALVAICALAVCALTGTGCQGRKPESGSSIADSSMADSSIVNSPAGDSAPTPPQPQAGSGKLRTRLGIAGTTFTADSVPVSFTVINPTDSALRFCRWETPFEPKLGKYLEVISEQGTEAAFKGAMARRVMPPPDESYITVAAHDSVRT